MKAKEQQLQEAHARRLHLEPLIDNLRSLATTIRPYEEYFEYRENGVAIGAHARASLMRYLLSGRLPEGPIDRAVAERFMVSALLVLESSRRLIDEFEPDVIVANHGIYMMAGVFGD